MCSLAARKSGNCDDCKAVRPRSHQICSDKAKNPHGNFRLNEKIWLTVLLLAACLLHCSLAIEDEEDGPYRGKYLGKINSYHHQVSGDVYAVNEYTFLIIGFNYDGNGADTFFWAGASNRPGPQGFIVPDEYGKTNILDRYHNKDFTLSLPDRKKITEIKWLAVYDLNNQNNFGDVYIPEEFEPPRAQAGGTFSRRSHNVSSSALEMLDSKTIRIKDFTYDGLGKRTFFWTGVGAQPSSRGSKIPDEMGYLDPIRKYEKETITLELPGDKTIFDIDWISIYDLSDNENYGHILIADNLNVPPSLVKITPYEFSLPNCRQLHKNLQVSWEVFGPQITLQLSGQVEKNDYMSFGISGSDTSSQMIGADVVVAYIDDIRGYSVDYNITSLAPCVQVLGQNKGVCRDDVVGGLDSFQLNTYSRKDGINTITFRRTLISSDPGDKEIRLDKSNYVVWALGELDSNSEPAFHFVYPKSDILIDFNTTEPINDCFSFTKAPETPIQIWERVRLHDPTLRTFNAYLGPSGGLRGYQGITGHVSSGLAWYINGYMTPELYLKRGLTYAFKVRGGNNPHSPEHYHPMVITDEPHGGFDRLSDAKQSEIRVLAGVEFTRRGRPKPTAAGPLCLSKYPLSYDRRLDDYFPSFKKFNRSLISICPNEEPAILEITPNITWPDTVYYNSFTHANMGWKIHIIDSFTNIRNGALQNVVTFPCHLGLLLLYVQILIKLIRDQ
ncbi:PREDICTED: protein Skeletor, isoforms B/C isoform X1 [Bactrocera latifrons]|uniref:Protein Skeletor, isoforms B/C n=2 Tax=Bactrocera latifrons TaxID=174628 RepID=A0A0K8VNI7_BACLA|nr:PREDICTED: protein Skeletor, isoforms B/C isoform X1 [Bactrocera latifrons]XP_018791492.1 PREDICTED: protein Skeletor, isoforms B/C isoform X1 [Bactrocera latifrons]